MRLLYCLLLPSLLSSALALKEFKALTCNEGLSVVNDCSPDSVNYYGTLADLLASGDTKIPCGKCTIVDTIDGSELDGTATGINVEGMLYFPSTANLTLKTTHIIVQGILKMDPPSVALGNRVTIHMVGSGHVQSLFPHPENAMQCDTLAGCNIGKKVIAVAGGRLDIRGLEDPTCPGWTKLKSIVPPSESSSETTIEAVPPVPHEITLADPKAVECWSPNDELLITFTKSWKSQIVREIKYANTSTGKISFAPSDSLFAFGGFPESIENLSGPSQIMAAEVAWLSRTIIFDADGDGPSGNIHDNLHGGHFMIFFTPNVAQYIEGVEIRNFGQQGNLGKYPIHFHMSGSVDGSIVRKNVIRDSKQRCIVMHGSHNAVIEENVAFDTYGHCYMLEDGAERGNTFLNNLGARTRRQEISIGSSDHLPATLWITNPDNHFIGNVAAGSAHNCIWFELRQIRGVSKRLPENKDVHPHSSPLGTFKDNSAHNCNFRAITTYDPGYKPSERTIFEGTSAWKNTLGFFMHGTQNIVLKDSFFGYNKWGLLSFGNFMPCSVEDSTFVGGCNSRGIEWVKTGNKNTLRVKSSSFDFPGKCDGRAIMVGQACENCDYQMPILSNLTSRKTGAAPVLHMASKFLTQNFYIEDRDGSMQPNGLPGFFVNGRVAELIDSKLCSPQPYGQGFFCKNVCLRRVKIDTYHKYSDYKMVVTSLTDLAKSYVYEKTTWAKNIFDLVLPFDKYSVHFLRISNGKKMVPPVTITFDEGRGPPFCSQHITRESFSIECPEGYDQKGYSCLPSSPTISPAPIDPGSVLTRYTATDCIAHSGIHLGDKGIIWGFDNGAWFTYSDINFGLAGTVGQMKIKFRSGNWKGKMEVRLGDQNGLVIGTFLPFYTGGWNSFEEAYFTIDAEAIQGVQQITFVALGDADLDIDWWELAPPVDPNDHVLYNTVDAGKQFFKKKGLRQNGSLLTHWDNNDFVLYDNVWFGKEGDAAMIRVNFAKGCCWGKIEVRLDGRQGPIIGTFSPWQTGGWKSFMDATFDIDSTISGLHRLCFVGRNSGGIWDLFSFQLSQAMPSPAPVIAPPTSAPAINVALAGTASQKSTDYGGKASRAIDNNTSGNWGSNSITHTHHLTDPWWRVQLDSSYVISKVNVYNREDCCSGRILYFVMTIYKGSSKVYDSSIAAPIESRYVKSLYTFTVPYVVGDRVEIMIPGAMKVLSLAEVQVMGFETEEPTLSPNKR